MEKIYSFKNYRIDMIKYAQKHDTYILKDDYDILILNLDKIKNLTIN